MSRTVLFVFAAGILTASPAAAQRFGDTAAFDNTDADRNGLITRAEFAAGRTARFEKMDRNRDGAVTKADFERIARLRPEATGKLDALMAQADINRDGKLTRAEMDAAPMPTFDRADTDKNGVVDKAELAAFRLAMNRGR